MGLNVMIARLSGVWPLHEPVTSKKTIGVTRIVLPTIVAARG
jgi:hypothetical protein